MPADCDLSLRRPFYRAELQPEFQPKFLTARYWVATEVSCLLMQRRLTENARPLTIRRARFPVFAALQRQG
jgi:hypothetical protein